MNNNRNLTKHFDRYASVPHLHTSGLKIVSSDYWGVSRLRKSNLFFLLVHRFTDEQLCLLSESLQLLS